MSLPAALAQLTKEKRWVVWQLEVRNDKRTKPPRIADRGKANASTADPSTWRSYNAACIIMPELRPWQGIGFCLWGSNYIGFDLDKCVDDEGRIAAWALELIERCASYAEISPSGTGVRIIGVSSHNDSFTMLRPMPDGGRLEVYRNAKRYLTITGRQINNVKELAVLDDVVAELADKHGGREEKSGKPRLKVIDGGADSSTSGIFHKKVCKLFDSGLDPDEAVDQIRKKPKKFEDTKAAKYDKERRLLRETKRCFEKWKESKGAALDVKWSNGRLPMKTLVADARIALDELGVVCRHDLFRDKILLDCEGEALELSNTVLTDPIVHDIRLAIWNHFKFEPSELVVRDAVAQNARINKFDPMVIYLAERQKDWDNKARVDRAAVTYFGCPDTELNRLIIRNAMIAAARRIRQPGCKFDQIIVLEGPEGTNKSTAIMVLAGEENFSDQSILTIKDEKQQEALRGRWLYEIADLRGIHHAEVEAVKAFASRQFDRGRKAWGHIVEDQPRRCVLFATTNDKNYLKGDTGNRRWWPVPCGKINIALLKRDRDQLWGEAAELEAQGESLMLPEHLWGEVKKVQDERLEAHPWMEVLRMERGIKRMLRSPTPTDPGEFEARISSDYLLTDVLKIEIGRQRVSDAKQVKTLMNRLGWDGPKMLRVQQRSEPVKGYSRPIPTEEKVVDLDQARRKRAREEQ